MNAKDEIKPVGIAEFSQSNNDLSWVYWCDICNKDDIKKWLGCEKRRISWNGYDDAYWWDKVSKTEQSCTRTTVCGKKIQITRRGYVSEEIFEVKP